MIFVTVGTQLPFDRLVAAVDAWAAGRAGAPEVLAQVGAGRDDFSSLKCVRRLDGAGYAAAIDKAELIVAHAGTGSILTALDEGIPIVVMPRDHRRGEHRDDHQIQTARQLEKLGLVRVAWDEHALPGLVEELLATPAPRVPRRHDPSLVNFMREYLLGVLR